MTKRTHRRIHYSGNANARNHIPRVFVGHVKTLELAVIHADRATERISKMGPRTHSSVNRIVDFSSCLPLVLIIIQKSSIYLFIVIFLFFVLTMDYIVGSFFFFVPNSLRIYLFFFGMTWKTLRGGAIKVDTWARARVSSSRPFVLINSLIYACAQEFSNRFIWRGQTHRLATFSCDLWSRHLIHNTRH